jgi:hypothetical protein
VRLAEWPRMPFLRDELCTWVQEHLATLGLDEIAIYAVEEGVAGDGRRVLVATEIGLLDYRYGPQESTARFSMAGRLYPWQAVLGVDLRVETSRLWALEHRTSWSLAIARPRFSTMTDDPDLGRALGDFAKAAAIMAGTSGPPPDDAPAVDEPPPLQHAPAEESKPTDAPREASEGLTALRPIQRPVGPGPTGSASRPQS